MNNRSGSEGLTVQVLVGPPALSQFALQRVQRHAPNVVYAEFVHLLQVASPLAGEALERAEGLLRYGPQQQMPEPQGHHSHTVLPRRGTISPWSSKATDIFALSGLGDVVRVERGVRWFSKDDGALSADEAALLFDRMTEECWREENFDQVFAQSEPALLQSVGAAISRYRGAANC